MSYEDTGWTEYRLFECPVSIEDPWRLFSTGLFHIFRSFLKKLLSKAALSSARTPPVTSG